MASVEIKSELSTLSTESEPKRKDDGVAVVVQNLNVFMKNKKPFKKTIETQILHDVSMYAGPGKLHGIMGPSGSGKTTLLHALCQRVKNGRVEGEITFNGYQRNRDFMKQHCKFVMDETKQHEVLTVLETLNFAAKFKLSFMSEEKRKARVHELIGDFGLNNCLNTVVGGPAKKGISSGEMKRLSIALELLDDPHILFLDEPTSGLDSSLAWDLTLLLKKLAKQGRTVLCTVHQPRSQAFKLFDSLLVMQNGHVAYQGKPSDVRSHFEEIGMVIDESYNPSDFLTNLCSNSKNSETPLYMSFEGSKAGERHLKNIDFVKSSFKSEKVKQSNVHTEGEAPCTNSSCSKFGTLLRRQAILTWRNPIMRFAVIGINVFDAILIGGIFWQLRSAADAITESANLITEAHVNSPWGSFYLNGTDGEGNRPIMDIFDNGVDGQGSRPIKDLLVEDSMHLHENFPALLQEQFPVLFSCVHDKFELQSKYPQNIFDPMADLVDGFVPPEDFLDPAQVVSSVVTTLQTLHFMSNADWSTAGCFMDNMPVDNSQATFSENYERGIDLEPQAPYLTWWMGLFNGTYDLIDPLFTCAGLPPLEPLFTTTPDMPLPTTPPVGDGLKRIIDFILGFINVKIPQYPWGSCLKDDVEGAVRQLVHSNEAMYILQSSEQKKIDKMATGKLEEKKPKNTSENHLVKRSSRDLTIDHTINRVLQEAEDCGEGSTESCGPIGQFVSGVQGTLDDLKVSLGGMFNAAGAMFFISGTLIFATYHVILSFAQERLVVNREVYSGYYPRYLYFAARNIADLPFQIMPTIFFASVIFLLAGFLPTVEGYFSYVWACCCITIASTGYSYFLACIPPKMEMGVVLAPISLTIAALLSGFFLRDEAFPWWFGWMKVFAVYRWGFMSQMHSQFPPGGAFGLLSNEGVIAITGVKLNFVMTTGINVCLGVIYRFGALVCFQCLWTDVGLQ